MKNSPKVGTSHEMRVIVLPEHTIQFAGADLPAVLSTPALVFFLEHAALQLMLGYLDANEITVGTHVDLEHMAPALIGADVACTAKVVHVDNARFTFQVEARHKGQRLAHGVHKRRVVQTERLRKRLSQLQEE